MKPHPALFLVIASSLALPPLNHADDTAPAKASASPAPESVAAATPPVVTVEAITPGEATTPAQGPTPEAKHSTPDDKVQIRLNFRGTPLNDVLNYLSQEAGFVILQDTPVTGTVNVVSQTPINASEAVDLLNSILAEKGYIAVRNGRILKIVSRKDALKADLPVATGSDPEAIPKKDTMVTQILPVHFLDANKLVDNLRPLLAPDATINSNESSNAIILTETQTNIHRIAEIIHALDTSISSIAAIRVFPLRFADAKQLADVITQLFSTGQATTQNQGGGPGGRGFGRWGGFGMQGGAGGDNAANQSDAKKAVTKVVAVADTQSNSIIVNAPDALMDTIADIITKTDTSISDITETRIFFLKHADATEMANVLTGLYQDTSNTKNNNNTNLRLPPWMQQAQQNQHANQSERSLLQSRVVAVADARTNSVVVSASRDTMFQIAETVGRLDATDAKKQHVYIYNLESADPDNVAAILQGMFGNQNGTNTTNTQPSTTRLNQRTTTGASSDATDVMNINASRSGGR